MTSSAQIRQRISDLAQKRADLEKRIGAAQDVKSRKERDAASKRASASRTSSVSSQRSYLRQAETVEDAARREGSKIADLTKKLAVVARDEGQRNKELASALKSESAAQTRADEKSRKEREAAEKKRQQEARAEQIRRQQERLADEQRRLDQRAQYELNRMEDQAAAASLVAASEDRVNQAIAAIRPAQNEQLRILYVTATSRGDLRVDEEIRRVKAAVKASTHRDKIVIEHLPAATPGDLLDGLTSFRPHVVHFSGHANENVLVFDTGSASPGRGVVVTVDAFKNALDAPDETATLVVLNACRSAGQLQSLLGKVAMAVGMTASVGDTDAITFATRFYRTLAEGQSVSAALATARADMQMNGLPDHDLPTLVTLPGVDPTAVQLVIA